MITTLYRAEDPPSAGLVFLVLLLLYVGLGGRFGTFLALLLEPVDVEGFVLECSGEERSVRCSIRLDGLAKSWVGGGDEVWLILAWSVHNLRRDGSMSTSAATADGQ